MVIVLMGVAGSGKTTVGEELARLLDWTFCDADDFHSLHNREKMSRGMALNDSDRQPWLEAIRNSILRSISNKQNAIFACSALKKSYRRQLRVNAEEVKFVYLKGSPALLSQRVANRQGHFFAPSLLESQFYDLEEPTDVLEVDVSSPPDAIARSIIAAFNLH